MFIYISRALRYFLLDNERGVEQCYSNCLIDVVTMIDLPLCSAPYSVYRPQTISSELRSKSKSNYSWFAL